MDPVDSMLKGLNAAQRAAVTSQSSVVQVLAPPGSGKTKTLTARVAYLVSHLGKHPGNIIVCTFTVKAAREMRERLTALMGPDLVNKLILGTFHSISRRFLVTYGKHIHLNDKFGIADTSDSKGIITRIIKRLGLTIDPKTARNRISTFKSKGITAEQYANECASKPQKALGAEAAIAKREIVTLYHEYEEQLRVSNLLDYDDLLLKCGDLLRHYPACVNKIQAVLIDEFQDTNHVQFDLMRRFSSVCRVVTTVGDPDQSIYGWRSADVTNLKKMREHFPDLHTVNLEENYRSSGAILLAAQEIIEQDESRPVKSLMPTHALGLSPVLRRLPHASKEADWLVSELTRTISLAAGLLKWDDYAILLRSAALSRLIEIALAKGKIPYRMVGGHRFFDRYEVKLILDYLRVIDLPDHTDALTRVLNVPARQIGDGTIKVLLDEAARQGSTLWKVVKDIAQGKLKLPSKARTSENGKTKMVGQISKKAQKGIEAFFDIIHSGRAKLEGASEDTLQQFLQWVIKKIGLLSHLKEKYAADELESHWANVEELIANAEDSVLQQYAEEKITFPEDNGESSEENLPTSRAETLSKFLGNVALSTETLEKEDDKQSGHVTISTIHAAKGLEWPVVFIPAVYEGSIPHSRAEDHDEERRLLYVAMTRAKAMLYLSYPDKNSQMSGATLSSFVDRRVIIQHFSNAGPSIKTQDVQEMSLILGRSCPTGREIAVAQENTKQREDRKFLRTNSNGEELDYTDNDSDVGNTRKRTWPCQEGTLPHPKRVLSDGFKTVKILMNDGQLSTATATLARNTDLPALVAGERFLENSHPAPPVSGKRSKENGQKDQSSIRGFFNSAPSRASLGSAKDSKPPLQPVASNCRLPQPSLPIQATVSATHTFAKTSQGMAKSKTILSPFSTLQSTVSADPAPSDSIAQFKPASTFHLTSMAQVGAPPVRKSLGMRKPMRGWDERKHK